MTLNVFPLILVLPKYRIVNPSFDIGDGEGLIRPRTCACKFIETTGLKIGQHIGFQDQNCTTIPGSNKG